MSSYSSSENKYYAIISMSYLFLSCTKKQFIKLASIKEVESVPKANEMIQLLVNAHEAVARTARSIFDVVDEANDQPTADVLTQRLDIHEKTAWMLRSLLE